MGRSAPRPMFDVYGAPEDTVAWTDFGFDQEHMAPWKANRDGGKDLYDWGDIVDTDGQDEMDCVMPMFLGKPAPFPN